MIMVCQEDGVQDELAQTGRQVLLLKQVHHWPVIKGVLQVTRWTQKMHKPWELHVWPLITEVEQAARADSGGGSVLCSLHWSTIRGGLQAGRAGCPARHQSREARHAVHMHALFLGA